MSAGASLPAEPPSSDDPGASTLLSAADVARVTDRIAHQIIENVARVGFDAVLLGIPTRGVPLADRLADRIRAFADVELPVGSLDITLHRDDLRMRGVRPLARTRIPDVGIDGRTVVLIDDVLCSGRTVRAALDALTEIGRPSVVQLATLVDRGHRQLPIRADYVGKNLPTSPQQNIRVLLREIDGEDAVLLDDPAGSATRDATTGGVADA
jgi:pyrimidine operon attenuation protein / uracil phosphoribosyltransferase